MPDSRKPKNFNKKRPNC